MFDELDALKARLLAPISDGAPAGEDPKYEDAYDQLKQEIAKLGGMGAGATDWAKVESQSIELLEQTSKELNLICYLTAAWTQNRGLPGLIVGVETAAELMGEYWDVMFPPLKRLKPRRNAISWLHERLNDSLTELLSEDRAMVERGQAAIKAIKDVVYDKFEDPPVNFRKARDTFDEWHAQLPAEAPPEPVVETPPPTAQAAPRPATPQSAPPQPAAPQAALQPATAPARSAPTEVQAPTIAAEADLTQLAEALIQIAGQLRPQPLDAQFEAAPYQLQRLGLWLEARTPRADDQQMTFFPPPADEVRNAITTMAKRALWADVLERCEDLSGQYWYWLDLQYYAAQAAEFLEKPETLRIIQSMTFDLDTRHPSLKELKFNDGLPFASQDAKNWLSGLANALAAGDDGGGGVTEANPADDLLKTLRGHGTEAFDEAMAAAQTSLDEARSPRQSFQLKLAVAKFYQETDNQDWAAALVEGLLEDPRTDQLAYWEPTLVREAWRLMHDLSAALLEEDRDRYSRWLRESQKRLVLKPR